MLHRFRHYFRLGSEWMDEKFSPAAGPTGERFSPPICKFLQSRAEIAASNAFLRRNGYVSHAVDCKDWDLALILPELGPGNFLDLGSPDSYILKNLVRKKIAGDRVGIDLREPDVPVRGVRYIVGDLMATGLPDGYFQNITCLSVVEHEVDFDRFMRETSRLLKPGGKLFMTFDYWEPKVATSVKMYGLKWQPLDRAATEKLIAAADKQGLRLYQDVDWKLGDAVIDKDYYSPDPAVSYTFGLVVFEKR